MSVSGANTIPVRKLNPILTGERTFSGPSLLRPNMGGGITTGLGVTSIIQQQHHQQQQQQQFLGMQLPQLNATPQPPQGLKRENDMISEYQMDFGKTENVKYFRKLLGLKPKERSYEV